MNTHIFAGELFARHRTAPQNTCYNANVHSGKTTTTATKLHIKAPRAFCMAAGSTRGCEQCEAHNEGRGVRRWRGASRVVTLLAARPLSSLFVIAALLAVSSTANVMTPAEAQKEKKNQENK